MFFYLKLFYLRFILFIHLELSNKIYKYFLPKSYSISGDQLLIYDNLLNLNNINFPSLISLNKYAFYKNGKLHRESGPAIVSSYLQEWYFDGKRHRDGGPAFYYKKSHMPGVLPIKFYNHGELHREDGPAILEEFFFSDGKSSKIIWSKYWFFNGQKINCNNQKEFDRILKLKAFV